MARQDASPGEPRRGGGGTEVEVVAKTEVEEAAATAAATTKVELSRRRAPQPRTYGSAAQGVARGWERVRDLCEKGRGRDALGDERATPARW